MKCPYCQNEMETGLIQSPQEISWIKGEKRHLFAKSDFYGDAVVLSEFSFLKGSAAVAGLCRRCKKVILDYGDPGSDLNRK